MGPINMQDAFVFGEEEPDDRVDVFVAFDVKLGAETASRVAELILLHRV
jgi:hypothetical protein